MRTTLILATTLSFACATGTDTVETTTGALGGDLEKLDFSLDNKFHTTSPGIAIEVSGDYAPTWWPAEVPHGEYDREVLSVVDDTCDLYFDLEETVVVEDVDGASFLWGYALMVTDGEMLRVAGFSEYEDPDWDCTTIEIREGMGHPQSPTEFSLAVHRMVQQVGDECEDAGVPINCSMDYVAHYDLIIDESYVPEE